MYRHGFGVEQSHERAFEYYQEAARVDFPESVVALAECYEHGLGTPQNLYMAAKTYERAAALGDIRGVIKRRELEKKLKKRFDRPLSGQDDRESPLDLVALSDAKLDAQRLGRESAEGEEPEKKENE